jgi:hypothetical protein
MRENLRLSDASEGKPLRANFGNVFTPDLVNFDAPVQEKARLAIDDKFKANGFLPADFQITGLAECEQQHQKYKLYELPASQAREPMPPLAEELKLSPSPVKLNIQMTNVPEVSTLVSERELATCCETVLQAGITTMRPMVEHLTQPNAVNNDMIATTEALYRLPECFIQNPEQVLNDGKNTVYWAIEKAEAVLDRLDKPMTAKERAVFIGANLPYFFMKFKLFDPEVAEEMGLAKMTEEELAERGIHRFQLPQLKLEGDGYSIQARVPGDKRAWMRAELPSEGVLEISDLSNGALPSGTGSKILAQALKGHGKMPTKRLILKDVINPPTRRQFMSGMAPEKTVMGKCATKALKELGLTPANYRFEQIGETLNLIIDME